MKEQENRQSDFETVDYLSIPLVYGEIVKHLESWLREAMVKSFVYGAEIDENGRFVSCEQDLVEMNERAVEVRKGQVGEKRIKSEAEGVEKMRELFIEASVNDLLILGSPPGLEREGFGKEGQRRLSFNYVGFMEKEDGDKKQLRVVAMPSKEIAVVDHVNRFNNIFENCVPDFVRDNPSDRAMVSTPFLVRSEDKGEKERRLDDFAMEFRGVKWGEIEEEIEGGLKLEGDEWAESRRKSLINSVAWQIRRYVDEENEDRLRNIGEAVRITLAREAAGHFVGWEEGKLLNEYEEVEQAMWIQSQVANITEQELEKMSDEWGAQMQIARERLEYLSSVLMQDQSVQEILMGSSCGGGGVGELMGSGHMLEQQLNIHMDSEVQTEEMKCVKCPFCSKTVDAIVTTTKIKCPKCKKEVKKS